MNTRTDWFRDAGYGIIVHFLKNWNDLTGDWNRHVDAFDAERFAGQVERIGAGYVILTLGQGEGYYCAPNTTFEQLLGCPRGSRCSDRDLPLDLHAALERRGIRLMLYFVGDASWNDPDGQGALGYDGGGYTATFRSNVIAMAREWAVRYGTANSGWWIDGCGNCQYDGEEMQQYADALRAGNPQSIIAFNMNNLQLHKTHDAEDYTAGERFDLDWRPESRWLEGLQWHLMSYLGSDWGGGGVKYADEQVARYLREVMLHEGVVTLDMQIRDGGVLHEGQWRQMCAVRDLLQAAT